jgi:hypothetical protein
MGHTMGTFVGKINNYTKFVLIGSIQIVQSNPHNVELIFRLLYAV